MLPVYHAASGRPLSCTFTADVLACELNGAPGTLDEKGSKVLYAGRGTPVVLRRVLRE